MESYEFVRIRDIIDVFSPERKSIELIDININEFYDFITKLIHSSAFLKVNKQFNKFQRNKLQIDILKIIKESVDKRLRYGYVNDSAKEIDIKFIQEIIHMFISTLINFDESKLLDIYYHLEKEIFKRS